MAFTNYGWIRFPIFPREPETDGGTKGDWQTKQKILDARKEFGPTWPRPEPTLP